MAKSESNGKGHQSAVSSVVTSVQGQDFSGHQLRINHFTSDVSGDYVMEVNLSSPIYEIGLSLPQESQEPWATHVDTSAVASIAPQSCVPHIPIKEREKSITNVNVGSIKVLGIKACHLHHKQNHHPCELSH